MRRETDSIPALTVMKGYLSLMRPLNAMVTVLAILSVGILATGTWWSSTAMLLAAVSAALIGSAGNIINDVFDRGIDRINKPRRAIASGMVSPGAGMVWAAICGLVGVLLGSILGPGAFAIALGSVLLLFLYSAMLKRIPIVGNLVVGLVTGAAFLYGGVAAGAPFAGVVPAFFACAVNIGREIIKDVEDMPGDQAGGHRTLPLLIGAQPSLRLAGILLFATAVATVLPWTLRQFTFWYLPLVFLVDALILAAVLPLTRTTEPAVLRRSSILLKLGMVAGIVAFTAGSLR
ncbi:MAG: geranylgeranylglycerol-phosphate geranylgeranyltransferase [Bacteroidia bacterium]|nr:geranylgeranylglycerol-phosphate geranylgeranyltransferase [Bacteroidia bacterium]